MKFITKLTTILDSSNSHVCVGLDSRYDRIPESIKKGKSVENAIFEFNKAVVTATHDLVVAYKSNVAFYAGFGAEGLAGLRRTNEWIRSAYPDIPLFADCKRSEMGESVKMVEQEIFKWLGFDCVMATPWFGFDTIRDYLHDDRHGVALYVHDSNPSAVELQDLQLSDGRYVYEEVARLLRDEWNTNGNVIVEAGATYPKALRKIREIVGEQMPILTAGVGAQGATVDDIAGTFGASGKRLFVNSSRGIIFAGEGKKDYFGAVREAAQALRDQLSEASQK